MNKERIENVAIRVAKSRYVAQHSGTGEGINFTNYVDFAHALLTELRKDAEPVAEVCDNGTPEGGTKWLVRLSHKLLKDGDKLYTHPTPVIASEQKPVAWVDVTDRHEGPYNFNGLELLDSGKHLLYTTPPDTAELSKDAAPVIASEQKPVDVVPPAWTNLIEYVLQDDLHNRLTPRVVDIAYTAFMLAKQPNSEDGGNSDWFNDTKPSVMEAIAKLRKDLVEFTSPPNIADIEQRVAEAWYDGNKFYANEESASMACADMANLEPLFTLPPTAEQIEQATAEAIAKMIQGWSCTNGPSIAEAIRSGKWREYL